MLMLVLCVISALSQPTFQENIISTNANGAKSVFAVDIDGDGDIDVISASYNDNKIAWYENIDGLGNFSTEKIITINAIGVASVFAIDIDADGDVDIIYTSSNENKLAWFKNLDGEGNFGTEQIINTTTDNPYFIYATDIDGDSDVDIITTSNDSIMWYENSGQGNFYNEHFINYGYYVVYAEDIDNDGDNDVVYNTGSLFWVAWSENTNGTGSFSQLNGVNDIIYNVESLHLNDFNNDGKVDIVYVSSYKNVIVWSENKGDSGSSIFDNHIYNKIDTNFIDTLRYYRNYVYSDDLDNDGDIDVINSSADNGEITWYENLDGLGNFDTSKLVTVNTNILSCIYTADLDGDGDIDIISASSNDNKIAWYENMLIDNVKEISQASFRIFPNPAKSTITIQSKFKLTKIELYNNLGQLVLTKQNTQNVDVSSLEKGVYTCKVFGKNRSLGTEKIVIE